MVRTWWSDHLGPFEPAALGGVHIRLESGAEVSPARVDDHAGFDPGEDEIPLDDNVLDLCVPAGTEGRPTAVHVASGAFTDRGGRAVGDTRVGVE